MKDILDLHTHTLASGHAYSTIKEMAESAKEKGIVLLGITEHSMKMPGTCHEFYLQNLKIYYLGFEIKNRQFIAIDFIDCLGYNKSNIFKLVGNLGTKYET